MKINKRKVVRKLNNLKTGIIDCLKVFFHNPPETEEEQIIDDLVEGMFQRAFEAWDVPNAAFFILNDEIRVALQWKVHELEIQPFVKWEDGCFSLKENPESIDDDMYCYRACLHRAFQQYLPKEKAEELILASKQVQLKAFN